MLEIKSRRQRYRMAICQSIISTSSDSILKEKDRLESVCGKLAEMQRNHTIQNLQYQSNQTGVDRKRQLLLLAVAPSIIFDDDDNQQEYGLNQQHEPRHLWGLHSWYWEIASFPDFSILEAESSSPSRWQFLASIFPFARPKLATKCVRMDLPFQRSQSLVWRTRRSPPLLPSFESAI